MTGRASRRVAAVLLATTTGITTACGTSTPAVSDKAGASLSVDVSRLRTAAVRGTAGEVASAAEALRAEVAKQVTAGGLSPARAAAVLDQLTRVLADRSARPATTPTSTPSPKLVPTEKSKDEEGGGNGEGD